MRLKPRPHNSTRLRLFLIQGYMIKFKWLTIYNQPPPGGRAYWLNKIKETPIS